MSLAERIDDRPHLVSLATLLHGGAVIEGETDWQLEQYVHEIVASGLPGVRELPDRARRLALDGYLERIVERDMVEQGYRMRAPESLRAWLRSYARATASTASYTVILDEATTGERDKPSKPTTAVYRDVLTQLWMLDPVPAWRPAGLDLGRIARAPKHYLADPALAARLMDLDEDQLLSLSGRPMLGPQEATALGSLFEALTTLSVRVYAQAAEARVSHYREQPGAHEVDLIVEARGRTLAIEVKLAASIGDYDVRHLNWLAKRIGDRLADRVVITTGPAAYRRPDGVAVVPLALLGP